MPGGGSALQMIQTIKFNKSLLSNRKSFGELKAYLNRRIERRAGLKIKDIDPVKLKGIKAQIRIELQEERRRNTIVVWSLIVTGILVLLTLVSILYSGPFLETDPDELAKVEYNKYKKEKAISDAQNKFDYYITDGYEWLEKNKFHNAIYQFELAVKTRPSDYEANLGLSKALLKQCSIERVNCKEANSQLNSMVSRFGNYSDTKQVLSNYLLSIGDTNRAVSILSIDISN